MFHVKICGVTTPADARLVAAAGADAVGINFVAGSPRCVDPEIAREVAEAVPAGVLTVGVFAGMPAAEIARIADTVGLDAVQLHGHLTGTGPDVDPPQRCAELRGRAVIRAVRLGSDGLEEPRRWIAAARAAGRGPDMVVVDATVPGDAAAGVLGGTGAVVDWEALVRAGGLDVPLALAGGLTPLNVADAIRATAARAVDTASGVESAPGVKDAGKTRAFVAAALHALGRIR